VVTRPRQLVRQGLGRHRPIGLGKLLLVEALSLRVEACRKVRGFTRFVDDYEGRLKNWRFAMDESARLRDELAELITSGEITARLKPL